MLGQYIPHHVPNSVRNPMVKLRVLLADDHALVRECLKLLIDAQSDMEVVAEASNGRAAVQKAVQIQPDVAVMEVFQSLVSSASAIRQIKQSAPQTKVLVLTLHEDKYTVREMLNAGVSGYVLKRSTADDLIRAIRTLASGGVYLDQAFAGRVMTNLTRKPQNNGGLARRVEGIGGELSERETDVLRRIAQGYGTKEVAVRLDLSVKTVESHKARAMEKAGLDSRVDIMRYAVQQGWLST